MIEMHNRYAIAAGNKYTADAAEEILKDGGNAIDAAVAAYWTACTAEPCMASAGAGGFAMVQMQGQKPVLHDFFCQTPRSTPNPKVDFRPLVVDFGDNTETFYVGSGSIAVPGAVAGMFAIQERYGSRSMPVLAIPGVEAAKNGVVIDPFQAHDIGLLQNFLGDTAYGKSLFYKNGKPIGEGEQLVLPAWADYLEYLSRQGAGAFYQDEPMRHLLENHGGHFSKEDFHQYRVIDRKPLDVEFKGSHIFTNPFPSSGGIILGLLLKEMRTWPDTIWKDRVQFALLWTKLSAKIQATGLSIPALADLWDGALEGFPDQKHGSTSHISILDQWGNAVSMTFSIGEGSGYFIPGTDIHMNNMLGEPSLLPKGLFTWQPNMRLSSMMSPTIAITKDKGCMAIGTGGAGRIPFMLAQVLAYYLGVGLPLSDAVEHPRIHLDKSVLQVEPGWPDDLNMEASRLNRWKSRSLYFGGVHSVAQRLGSLQAIGDIRRYGVGRLGH